MLEAVVALPQFITTALLRFNALLANILPAALGLAIASSMRREIVIFLKVAEIILLLWLANGTPASWAGGCTAGTSIMTMDERATVALWWRARDSGCASAGTRRIAGR